MLNTKRCIDQRVKRWEEKHQVLASEVDLMVECQRKSIVVVCGLEEKRNEGYMDTVEIIHHFLKEVTKSDVLDKVYFATRAVEDGGRRRPVLDRFITCGAKAQLLRNGGHLRVCIVISAETNFDQDKNRKMKKELLPF